MATAQRIYIKSLYKRSLNSAFDWTWKREIWRRVAVNLRDSFDELVHIKDPRALAAACRDIEANLREWQHPDPYKYPTAPGGTKWERDIPPPIYSEATWDTLDAYTDFLKAYKPPSRDDAFFAHWDNIRSHANDEAWKEVLRDEAEYQEAAAKGEADSFEMEDPFTGGMGRHQKAWLMKQNDHRGKEDEKAWNESMRTYWEMFDEKIHKDLHPEIEKPDRFGPRPL